MKIAKSRIRLVTSDKDMKCLYCKHDRVETRTNWIEDCGALGIFPVCWLHANKHIEAGISKMG